ncbi:MAG: polysaccharide biosynthesis tyrosine autokinase [Gemmatimonadaceae bacterium]|nr:polysaccharide biosynthesis tyrosine autokinase [Gemmatimonadaceae bacterium]
MTRPYNALPSGSRLAPMSAPASLPAIPQPPAEQWGAPPPPPAAAPVYQRYLSAIGRFKWLVMAMMLLGLLGGYIATRYIKPEFDVQGKVTLRDPSAEIIGNSRLRSNESYLQVFRAYIITDSVARKLHLYLDPKRDADSVYFRDFTLGSTFVPGTYELMIDSKKEKYRLRRTRNSDSREVETGTVGDSIGRESGMRWRPMKEILPAKATVEFELITPREASNNLQKKLRADAPPNTDVMNVSLRGEDAAKTEVALNEWMALFVNYIGIYKNGGATQNANAARKALADAEARLKGARQSLERFRVDAITKPSEQTVLSPGVAQTQNPVLEQFTRFRLESQNLRNDREFLEGLLQPGRLAEVEPSAAISLNSVQGAGGEALRRVLEELNAARALYRAKNAFLTDSAPEVQRIRGQIVNLESSVIPGLIRAQIKSLRLKEEDYNRRIAVQSGEIKGIPERTIREEELRAQVEQEQKLTEYLSSNLETQRLKEASARNEVFVQDSAVAPFRPTSNTAFQIIPAGIALGLALGLGLAILLDLLDKRVRYPEQVSNDLRLDIIGAIPLVHPGRPSVEEQAQLVESFRTLRLSLRHQFTAGEPVSFTVTSTGPTEGKSFVSSNLALSFAEAGFRTVLVDGDTRRGAIQQAFGVPQKPGLVDYLQGGSTLDETVYPTSYERLSLVPCGSRHRQAPEMVTTAAMESLLDELRARFDVVIVDSPPLGAGTDAYALATLTGGLLMVLRVGVTDRKMAVAKLETMDRLPIRPLGAVLNGIEPKGVFQYYHYLEGYNSSNSGSDDDEPIAPLPRKSKPRLTGNGKA